MVWTSSITMPSMVGIVGHAPAVYEKCDVFLFVFKNFYQQASTKRSHAGIVFTQ